VAQLEKHHPEFGRPSLSMGIAESPRHGETPDTILGAADAALYRAKRGGRDTVETAGEG
jgi:PleD family two-component response regulator